MTRPGGRLLTQVGILLVVGVGFYVFSLRNQSQAAADLCDNHPVGSAVENLEELEGTSSLTPVGPIELHDAPGTTQVIFCAALTMCDTSCRLRVENGRVIAADFSSL
jgi:hypothetical protein